MNGYIHEHYNRQPIPADWNPNSCPLVFQHFECDYYVVDKHHSSIPSMSDSGSQTIVRLFGVTDDGHSVLAHVHSYAPYLYIPSPGDNLTSEDLRQFEAELNQLVCQNQSDKRAVIAVEIVRKQSMFGYHANENDPFLRISFTQPKFMSASRSHLENGIKIGNYSARPYTVFEVNIDLEIRFLVDTGLVSCGWVELPSSRYSCRAQNHRQSRSQFEVDVQLADIIAHKPDQDPWMRLAPARILSFDIECAGRKGIFPEPNKDAVIQIANVCKQQGSDDIMFKNVFTLNTCAAIADTDVFSFRTEAELLRAWSKFFIAVDADVVTGYNIQNFDFTYLLARADHLNLKEFAYLGRIIDKPTSSKRSGFQSKQMGRRETHNICMDGRVVFDVYLAILREQINWVFSFG